MILYHGTNKGNLPNEKIFLSTSKEFAEDYGKTIFQITISDDVNLIDTTNYQDCEKIISTHGCLYDTYYSEDEDAYYIDTPEKLSTGDNWEAIENTNGVLDWVNSNYDGIWIYEGGIKNLILLNLEKIESVSHT